MPQRKTDVIFVLLGSSLSPAEQASELRRWQYAPKIAFVSMGRASNGEALWDMSAIAKYQELLKLRGISNLDVIQREFTIDVQINPEATSLFLQEQGIKPERIILVSQPVCQRQMCATFKKHWPSATYFNCPGDEPLIMNREMFALLLNEVHKLDLYGREGSIVPQDIPSPVREAFKFLDKYLSK